jgi:hypothetical protein
MPGCSQVYEEYMRLGFNQDTYRLCSIAAGSTMVLYPTAALTINCVKISTPSWLPLIAMPTTVGSAISPAAINAWSASALWTARPGPGSG